MKRPLNEEEKVLILKQLKENKFKLRVATHNHRRCRANYEEGLILEYKRAKLTEAQQIKQLEESIHFFRKNMELMKKQLEEGLTEVEPKEEEQ